MGPANVGVLVVAEEVMNMVGVALLQLARPLEQRGRVAHVKRAQVFRPVVRGKLRTVDQIPCQNKVRVARPTALFLEHLDDTFEVLQVALHVRGRNERALQRRIDNLAIAAAVSARQLARQGAHPGRGSNGKPALGRP